MAHKTTRKDTAKGEFSTPAFKALADPTRLRILLMLEGRPRTVGEIVDFFDLSQPTISRHLQTLTAGGLARRVRKGQNVYYSVDALNISALCIGLASNFPCCCVEVIPVKMSEANKRSGGKKNTSKRVRTRTQTKSKRKGAGK